MVDEALRGQHEESREHGVVSHRESWGAQSGPRHGSGQPSGGGVRDESQHASGGDSPWQHSLGGCWTSQHSAGRADVTFRVASLVLKVSSVCAVVGMSASPAAVPMITGIFSLAITSATFR